MKKLLLAVGMTGLVAVSAMADFSTTFSSGFQNGGVIPDGSTIGVADTRTLTGLPFNSIQDVNVRLNISGGWNGDLYAYLVHSSGFTVLLNRVGRSGSSSFGYGDSGMNVTFDQSASQSTDIHFYQTVAGFTTAMLQGGTSWRPDGRNVSPLTPGATLASTASTADLNSFYRLDPNGTWTLFIADVSAGGGQPVLSSWGLDIVASVPEPASIIEASIAALLLGAVALLYRIRRLKFAA